MELVGELEHALAPVDSLVAGPRDDTPGDVHVKLVGRTCERRALDRTIDAVRGGRSSILVLHGKPGIGKTALLEYAREKATGCHVLSVSAVQPEMEFAFAALHQLCAPHLDRLDGLPAPQRTALATAFGLTEGRPPDRLFLGLAVLGLFTHAAQERPLVCLVDDAQWLDHASSEVLAFVARRLAAERIALVFAARELGSCLDGLPEMPVRSLSDSDARALLHVALRGRFDKRVAERMIAETNGNPLALLQSARPSTPTRSAGGFGDPDEGLATSRVDERLAQRLAALPDETRRFLLVAAAEPLGEPLWLWRAVERLGIPADSADAARNAGLLDIDTRVRFCDSAVRSAVYRSATPRERYMAHGALAEVIDSGIDLERHAWHRARAARTPDEDIAALLERSSVAAEARGGLAARAAFLLQAAALTPERRQRARRAVTAAEAAWRAGDSDAALRVLAEGEAGPLDRLGSARSALLRARIAFASGAHDAARRLFAAARRLEPLDIDLAREAYLDGLGATVHLGSIPGCEILEAAHSALAIQRRVPQPPDRLVEGIACAFTETPAAAANTFREALTAFVDDDTWTSASLAGGWLASQVASLLWQHEVQKTLAERQVRMAREAGALSILPQGLTQLLEVYLREGRLASADAFARELSADAAGSEQSVQGAMLTAAYRGREAEGRQLIDEARTHLPPDRRGRNASVVAFAEMLLNNGLARYKDALDTGRRLLEDDDPVGRAPWALPELVEAAARAGAASQATAALRQLEESARVSGTDWALGLEARSRALLSDGAEAERLYVEAIARLDTSGSRVELARAHLLYGEWLRRAGRRIDARHQLRIAHDMLGGMGVEAFAERARRELQATGETARKRVMETRDDLTPQEEEIARLARDGLSNPEIGARLFISPRTVEWHLRKIFAKLDISSRVALRDALPERTAQSA